MLGTALLERQQAYRITRFPSQSLKWTASIVGPWYINLMYIYIYKYIYICIYLKTWLARMETWQKSWDLYLKMHRTGIVPSILTRIPYNSSHKSLNCAIQTSIGQTLSWNHLFFLDFLRGFRAGSSQSSSCSSWPLGRLRGAALHFALALAFGFEEVWLAAFDFNRVLREEQRKFFKIDIPELDIRSTRENIFPTQWAADFLSFVSSIKARDVLIKNVSHSLIFVHHCCVSHMLWGKYSVSILRRTLWNASTFLGWGKMTLRTGAVGDMYIYIYIMHSNT